MLAAYNALCFLTTVLLVLSESEPKECCCPNDAVAQVQLSVAPQLRRTQSRFQSVFGWKQHQRAPKAQQETIHTLARDVNFDDGASEGASSQSDGNLNSVASQSDAQLRDPYDSAMGSTDQLTPGTSTGTSSSSNTSSVMSVVNSVGNTSVLKEDVSHDATGATTKAIGALDTCGKNTQPWDCSIANTLYPSCVDV